MECPYCTAALPDDDIFCEECGKPLEDRPGSGTPLAACVCGASVEEVDEDGFCGNCGRRVRPRPTDHMEVEISPLFAGVSDKGKRHDRNEDRFAIRLAGGRAILVVCDGVSSSRESELASSLGAEIIASMLEKPIGEGGAEIALRDAMGEAAAGIAKLAAEGSGDAPSTTCVTALADRAAIWLGWVGDSRAYWIDREGARRLTDDHSWLNRVVTSGELSAEEAEKSPRAHAITRWFGADAGEDGTPEFRQFPVPGDGTLLLCTDGLWNYQPDLVDQSEASALELCRQLTEFANSRGGQDNITVAMFRVRKEL